MSTHAFVGKRSEDGLIGQYINFDGYPTHTGRLLVQHHNSAAEVDGLIEHGQIRSLDENGDVERYYEGDIESYPNVGSVLRSGFDYAYIFEDGKYTCFTLRRIGGESVVSTVEIPTE